MRGGADFRSWDHDGFTCLRIHRSNSSHEIAVGSPKRPRPQLPDSSFENVARFWIKSGFFNFTATHVLLRSKVLVESEDGHWSRSASMLSANVIILCDEDQYANGVRPREISNVLRRAGATVTVISSAEAMSEADSRRMWGKWRLQYWRQLLKILDFVFVAQNRFPLLSKLGLGTLTVASLMKLRARLLQSYFISRSTDLMISESPLNQLIFTRARLATCQILDLPSPFGDELSTEVAFRAAGRESSTPSRRGRTSLRTTSVFTGTPTRNIYASINIRGLMSSREVTGFTPRIIAPRSAPVRGWSTWAC